MSDQALLNAESPTAAGWELLDANAETGASWPAQPGLTGPKRHQLIASGRPVT